MTPGADGAVAAYDGFARDYDALYPDWEAWAERSYETLCRLLPDLDVASGILDCACGTGMECYALATHGHRVHGSDASEKMLERARHRFADRGLGIPTTHCSWEDLPERFGTQRFDVTTFATGATSCRCTRSRTMTSSGPCATLV
jgi:ubiquinone/menaquinone biosynthesis C-methylase UbiE